MEIAARSLTRFRPCASALPPASKFPRRRLIPAHKLCGRGSCLRQRQTGRLRPRRTVPVLRVGSGFHSVDGGCQTIQGYDAIHLIRKRQLRGCPNALLSSRFDSSKSRLVLPPKLDLSAGRRPRLLNSTICDSFRRPIVALAAAALSQCAPPYPYVRRWHLRSVPLASNQPCDRLEPTGNELLHLLDPSRSPS